MSEKLVTYLSV